MNSSIKNQPALFDEVAMTYDSDFSTSSIGLLLRKLVWNKIEPYLRVPGQQILEINCGTGEDAVYLVAMGHSVVATDQSAEMIRVADRKKGDYNLKFEVLDFRNISARFSANSFDIIFSNFGGLNCANSRELTKILSGINDLLKPGGKFIGVIMSSGCLWERFYYKFKGDNEKKSRRKRREGVPTTIGSNRFNTYYYSPTDILEVKPSGLHCIRVHPVGFFIPPTYLETYFKRHSRQLTILCSLEKGIGNVTLLSNMADHFMIVLEKR